MVGVQERTVRKWQEARQPSCANQATSNEQRTSLNQQRATLPADAIHLLPLAMPSASNIIFQ